MVGALSGPEGATRGIDVPPELPAAASTTMSLAFVYDMDACRGPTGVTRHAVAQLERLRARAGITLQVISGRMSEPDGLVFWETLGDLKRRELPLRTRNALRWWRVRPWPPIEWWTGPVDWVYSPAEYAVPTRKARRAVTSHDVLQNLEFNPGANAARNREWLARTFRQADLILSVSRFNSERLLEFFPECAGRIEYVPNGAEDLFFEETGERDRASVREDLGLPPGMPYLLSVANFQPRKNLSRLVRASARLPEMMSGDLALVLLGTGTGAEEGPLRAEIATLGRKPLIRLPGYRQGLPLRAAYAEAKALVFPSLCESFGIPVVESMAQGTPVALADSTALPEVGGSAGWYFDPRQEEALAETISKLLREHDERARRVALGREIAAGYRWQSANDRLVAALTAHHERPRYHVESS